MDDVVGARRFTGFATHHLRISEDDDMIFPTDMDVKKGSWTDEEDALLANYVQVHGEGRWNSVAIFAGLKRTGKSCRLRWLNYLRPDLRRGHITLEEQLMIFELHSRWGNRWSKIAKYLPGRTDNEIKNYWRTRVQKQAKQLKFDVNSMEFRDTMRNVWIPQMAERIRTRGSTNFDPIVESGNRGSPLTEPTAGSCTSNSISNARPSSNSDLSSSFNPFGYAENNLDQHFSGSKPEQGLCPVENLDQTSDMWLGAENFFWNEDDARFLQQQLSDVDPWGNLFT